MPTTQPGPRLPTTVQARERLREAQVAEARAVRAVFLAQTRHDRAVQSAQAILDRADDDLAVARAGVVAVSGIDRAAALLGVRKAELRRAAAASRKRAKEDRP